MHQPSDGFDAGLSWSNCKLKMLIFAEGGKPANLEKTLGTNLTYIWHKPGFNLSPVIIREWTSPLDPPLIIPNSFPVHIFSVPISSPELRVAV